MSVAVGSWNDRLIGPFAQLFRHGTLTWELTRREIYDRYVGQVLGVMWAVGHPLMQMMIYIIVFQFIFKVRVTGAADLPVDYAVFLLSGLLPWLAFQESMAKGASVLVANSSLVKQVVFPIEVLPVKSVLSSWMTQLVGTVCLLGYMAIKGDGIGPMILLVPALWCFQCIAMIGVSMFLACAGAYVRDVKDIIQAFGVIGMYVAPIAYSAESAPEVIKPFLFMNPFSHMVWCYQDVLCNGGIHHWYAWIAFPVGSIAVFFFGNSVFRQVKPMIGNYV